MSDFSDVKILLKSSLLKNKLFNTLLYVIVFRIGSFVALPGVDASKLKAYKEGLLGILDSFVGGAFSNAAVLGLGIMPYISASIVVQLCGFILPSFRKLQMEGQYGQNKLNKITKLLTIVIGIVQAFSYLSFAVSDDMILVRRGYFTVCAICLLVAGTMFCVWLGDKISDKGIGNGTSLLIVVGIVASFPSALYSEYVNRGQIKGFMLVFVEILFLFLIILFVVAFGQATRKIPIQYVKQFASNVGMGSKSQHIPMKLNSSGVMPIIFAQTIMFLPSFILSPIAQRNVNFARILQSIGNVDSWGYNCLFSILIVLFTFFYTALTINPENIATDMKRNNGFIPGVQSGRDTAIFIDTVINRLILPNAILLCAIAILPVCVKMFGVSSSFSRFFGGTSLLILVGVFIEIVQQIDSFALLSKYQNMSGPVSYSKVSTLSRIDAKKN